MAATDEQKLKTRLALGISREEAEQTEAAGDSANGLFYLLDALDDAELTQLDAYLTAWEAVDTNTTDINVDGVSISPAKQRAVLLERICALVGYGYNPGLYPVGSACDTFTGTLADGL